MNSFSGRSDARSDFDAHDMNLLFFFPDGRAFDVPASFVLAQRYREIQGHLQRRNYEAAAKMIDAAIKEEPQNTNLRIARLQFSVVLAAHAQATVDNPKTVADKSKVIPEQIESILKTIDQKSGATRLQVENINQTAYFLMENNQVDAATRLHGGMLEVQNRQRFDITTNDTLSDLYLRAGQLNQCYRNDVRILTNILRSVSTYLKDRRKRQRTAPEISADHFRRYSYVGFLATRYNNENFRKYISGLGQNIDQNYRRYVMDGEPLPGDILGLRDRARRDRARRE